MGKALMVASTGAILASGDEANLFGYTTDTVTEANTQASATEAATFSALGFNIISGGSGTNNLQFRDAGANGNQLATRAGAGVAEDTTNTDVLAAADLFNLAYTDDGTNSGISWIKGNIEFSAGHGSFTGSASYNGAVHDVASATRFLPISGNKATDGQGTEADVAFMARGYDTFEALQVRVTANARTNNSVFRNRINNADGTGAITFGSGITGLLTATGLADSITDGQVINASITLLTGVEDLTVAFVCGALKSSASKQDIWAGSEGGAIRAASSTADYTPIGGLIQFAVFTEAQARIKPGFAGVASNLRAYLSANTYASNGTLKLYQNGVAVITTTLTASGGAGWYENATDTVTFDDNDEFSFEIDEGGATGSATFRMIGMTFAPAAGGAQTFLFTPARLDGIGHGGIFPGNRV